MTGENTMKEAEEYSQGSYNNFSGNSYMGNSYAYGRDGRYMNRDMGMSGHYPQNPYPYPEERRW